MDISIDKKQEAEFRQKAMERKGYKKGAFKEAMEEAIRDWLKKRESNVITKSDNSSDRAER